MALFIGIFTFFSVSFIIISLHSILFDNERDVKRRLYELFLNSELSLRDFELNRPLSERIIKPMSDSIYRFIASITPKGLLKSTEKKLIKSGNIKRIKPIEFITLKIILGLLLPLIIGALLWRTSPSKGVFMALLISAAGMILLEQWLMSAKRKRNTEIGRALPDMLDLLTVSVEAGLGFDSALSKVIEKSKGPLCDEFRQLLKEIQLGKPRREAFRDLARRTDVDDLSSVISALVQADQLGVGIVNTLRIQSNQMRVKRRQRAEEAAMKAPVKMLLPLIFFIFPAMFVVLLGPAIIQLVAAFAAM